MKFLLLFFLISSCSDGNQSYFPLSSVKSWSYKIVIKPEIDRETIYKKTKLSLGKTSFKIGNKKSSSYPFLREDGSIFFYNYHKDGIYRDGYAFAKDKSIKLEKKKRVVLPTPQSVGKKWAVDSKTYLILKRYPYYDYRATTNFEIEYQIISKNEIVKTPLGKFENCLLVKGIGKTKFIGDSEIGSIEISITSNEWYAKGIGLIKSIREEKTDSDLFGTTIMTQVLENFEK